MYLFNEKEKDDIITPPSVEDNYALNSCILKAIDRFCIGFIWFESFHKYFLFFPTFFVFLL